MKKKTNIMKMILIAWRQGPLSVASAAASAVANDDHDDIRVCTHACACLFIVQVKV